MKPSRAGAALLLAAGALAGCGPQSHLTLGMRTIAVTVPRIVTPALTLVPPSAPPPAPLPPVTSVQSQLPPPPAAAPTPAIASRPPSGCPPVSPFAVPKVTAGEVISQAPAAQSFVQRAAGSYHSQSGSGPLAGTVRITITDLPATTTSAGQKVESWRVQQVDAASKTRAVEVYQLVLPSAAPLATSPGVYLVGLAWTDPVRGNLTFQPSGNGLLVLPTPVQVAQNNVQYVGIGTDPNTLTTLQLTRNVHARKRIDVCGHLVDTWTVAMTGTLTAPGRQWNVTWNQQIATGYGAVDVDETLGLTDVAAGLSWSQTLVNTTVPKATP